MSLLLAAACWISGSFLKPEGIAGGNRARSRWVQLIQLKLDNLTG